MQFFGAISIRRAPRGAWSLQNIAIDSFGWSTIVRTLLKTATVPQRGGLPGASSWSRLDGDSGVHQLRGSRESLHRRSDAEGRARISTSQIGHSASAFFWTYAVYCRLRLAGGPVLNVNWVFAEGSSCGPPRQPRPASRTPSRCCLICGCCSASASPVAYPSTQRSSR